MAVGHDEHGLPHDGGGEVARGKAREHPHVAAAGSVPPPLHLEDESGPVGPPRRDQSAREGNPRRYLDYVDSLRLYELAQEHHFTLADGVPGLVVMAPAAVGRGGGEDSEYEPEQGRIPRVAHRSLSELGGITVCISGPGRRQRP
jgi:hypothetical protein